MKNWKSTSISWRNPESGWAGFARLWSGAQSGVWTAKAADIPDEILNPVEVYGARMQPVCKLPGGTYTPPAGQGEHHLIGSLVMTRVSRSQETAGVHEMADLRGPDRGLYAAGMLT